MIKKNILGHF